MNKIVLTTVACTTLLSGCATDQYGYGSSGSGYYDRTAYSQYGAYDYNNPDPRYSGYYADHYYHQDPRYRERQLSSTDRVYRGQDGRYYCRRSDGTTGLIVGGIAGGAIGNVIAPGGSEVLGTLLGAVGGALAGRAIERGSSNNNRVRCR
jgi:hypothetical protein